MILAIASGKGGTGKTTVALNLAKAVESSVQLMDCDVEEPNCHLFLKALRLADEPVFLPIPRVNESLCNACGLCSRLCQYHAIACLQEKALVFPELCHGCGGCSLVCPRQAIQEIDKRMGVIETFQAGNIMLVHGRLDVGVAMASPLIREVKKRLQKNMFAILDAPPGTSCPVSATLRDSDYVALVAEPTPFGLHDLILTVNMLRELNLPFGVIVNRIGMGDNRVHEFCREKGISLLMDIPDDRRIAEAYSRGSIVIDVLPEYRNLFLQLLDKIQERLSETRGESHANL